MKQRAKAHWLKNFDDDLKFLYRKVKLRNNMNVIKEIHSSMGPIFSFKEIAKEFCDYFENLFNDSRSCLLLHVDVPFGVVVNSTQAQVLDSCVTSQDIFSVLKDIDGNKSPGSDRFNSNFFLHYWDIVGSQFLQVAQFFFSYFKMLTMFKHSLIAWFPKSKTHLLWKISC